VGGGCQPHLLARSRRLNPTPTPSGLSPWCDEPKLDSELVGVVQAPARGPAASSWRGIRARRLPHPEFVGAAHAGVGTDMVPDGLLPRSHCCSLARCHRRFLRHQQTRGSRGCCYYTGSASSPSPPHPCWCHASPLSGTSTLQTCAPPTFSRRLKTMMGTVRGELIDMGERDKPRRLTRRHRGR
jgi:hypothetical protein